jgi:hypothetical protein
VYESYRDKANAGYEVQWGDEWIVNNRRKQSPSPPRRPSPTQEQEQGGGLLGTMADTAIASIDQDSMTAMNPSTYGEITPLGARQLMGAMGLMMVTSENDQKHIADTGGSSQPLIHFLDLGSGAGKLVCQVGLELNMMMTMTMSAGVSTIKDCAILSTGIELSPSRHEAAILAKEALEEHLRKRQQEPGQRRLLHPYRLDRLLSQLPPFSSCIEFIHDDMLQSDLSSATHVYVSSLCFPLSLMHALELKLVTEAPCLQCVATLQRFPNDLSPIPTARPYQQHPPSPPQQYQHQPTPRPRHPIVHYVEMSWTKPFGSAIYVYHL